MKNNKSKQTYGQTRNKGPRQVTIPENPTPLEREALLQRAQYTVSWHVNRSMKTVNEIRTKLVNKGFTEEYVSETLAWAQDLSLVDDYKYASMYAESRYKQYGTQRVRQDLTKKGIDRELIDQVIEEIASDDDQIEVATRFVHTRIRNLSSVDQKSQQRIFNALLRRGYSYGIAQSAWNAAMEDKNNEIDEQYDM